ncbi:MAG: CUB domain-containing protein, partial [Flexibacteraceae bacterium]
NVVVTGGVCAGNVTLTSPSGTLTDGPGVYVSNATCSWLINGVPNSTFRFSFTALATERNYDFVRIYNGTNNTGTLIGEYSGTTLPANIEFVGTSAFVTFTSDVSNEFEGFVLNYNFGVPCTPPATPEISAVGSLTVPFGSSATLQPNVPSGQGYNYLWSNGATTRTIDVNIGGTFTCRVIRNNCTSLVSNPLTVIISPAARCSGFTSLQSNSGVISDGSNNYLDNMNCSWSLTRPSSGVFTFNFLQLNTEAGYDQIIIYNGTNEVTGVEVGRYSGRVIPNQITFTGSSAFISFTSDGSQTSTGFNLAYSFRPTACDSVISPTLSSSSAQTLCSGGSIVLNGPSGINYLWSNGETEQNLVVTNPGTYTLRRINGECTSSASLPIEVTLVDQLPTPFVVASGNTTVCDGQSVTLEGPAGYNYIWSNGDTTQTSVVRTAGEYSLRVRSGSCTSEVSSTILVTILPAPAQPVISYIGWDSLDAGVAANSYIWNYNNNLISGSGRKIAVRGPGTYVVTGIGNRSCRSQLSAPFVVNSTPSP